MRLISRSKRLKGQMAYHAGASAEDAVIAVYCAHGMTLAARRWRGGGGELDIVLRDASEIVFVEVKTSRSFARAAASLSDRQIARLHAAASAFLAGEPAGLLTAARFDVALVDGQGAVEIHENALIA